jgi:hypothetical protein
MDWAALPIQHIPLDRIVFPCHDLDPDHVHAIDGLALSSGPIHLEQLLDGSLFVHDGRHRVLRAQHAGDATIPARIHA